MAYYCTTYTGSVPDISDWEFNAGRLNAHVAKLVQEALNDSLNDMLAIRLDGKDILAQMIFSELLPDEKQPAWRMPIADLAEWWFTNDPEDPIGVSMETVSALRDMADRIEKFLNRD